MSKEEYLKELAKNRMKWAKDNDVMQKMFSVINTKENTKLAVVKNTFQWIPLDDVTPDESLTMGQLLAETICQMNEDKFITMYEWGYD